ncbi:MAG: metallophosphatase family protein [Candidatus Thermoplasmatota archaeon]|nr:metallophosphatase family protein [Candidatus Thermoplasmatota archaeon]
MKLGIISDVHSNVVALKKVLSELKDVEMIIHAGDVVGYNPYPNEVVKIFREKNIFSLLGNHDMAVITGDTSNLNHVAAETVRWTRNVLSDTNIGFLKSLKKREKIKIGKTNITVIHGSPWNDDEYVYENDLSKKFLDEVNAEILVYGHTHVPCLKKFGNGIIINPGSIGQPRDGNPKASFAAFDTDKKSADIKRTNYDIKAVTQKIMEYRLPDILAYRLPLGE